MQDLKCKSCKSNLQKNGNVYICKNCGEVFKEEELDNSQSLNEQSPVEIAKNLLNEGKQPIEVIKVLRDTTGMGLAEAKNIVDSLKTSNNTQQTGGCYIATCVYGSYDCPQVWVLRRYRDYELDKTFVGRCFIHIYYSISPKLVKWFGNRKWFKKIWKIRLDKMVHNLKQRGFKDTKYKDKNISGD